jgi:hypothetical protein
MISLQLTPLGRARVWFGAAELGFVPSGAVRRAVDGAPANVVAAERVALEVYVPRGGRAEYGLLGMSFRRHGTDLVQVEVPYTDGAGASWPDALAARGDDVRLGLPSEYAMPVLDAIAEVGARRVPPGTLRVAEAAHGLVGSSPAFFRRLAVGAMGLLLDDRGREESNLVTFLRGIFISP